MSTSWKKLALSTTAFSLLAGNAFATDYTVSQGTDTSVSNRSAPGRELRESCVTSSTSCSMIALRASVASTHTITFSIPR